MDDCRVTFLPQNKSVFVGRDTDILSAAAKAGIILNASCGGAGLCGKCRVIVRKGDVRSEASGVVTEKDRRDGVALACQSLILSDVEIEIPSESLVCGESNAGKADDFTKGIISSRENQIDFLPLVSRVYIELNMPDTDDNTSDLDRLIAALKEKIGFESLSNRLTDVSHLSLILRDNDLKVTVTFFRMGNAVEILSIEPGDSSRASFAVVFDIGTTTIAGQLIDLSCNKIIGTRIAFNKQSIYGADVISRIIFASSPEGLSKLSRVLRDNMNEIISDLVSSANISGGDIFCLVCAGNMTMMHLLLKIDPSGIRKVPYVPVVSAFRPERIGALGLSANPRGITFFMPGVSAYLGGDIVSGVMACGMDGNNFITMLVDIGTNGEIVMGNHEWLIGASASAGAAFEGSGLQCGMKAVGGAIEKISISSNLDISFRTISSMAPKGICGSGYIDLLHQMLRRNIIGKDGKMNREIDSRRIRKSRDSYEFVLVYKEEASIGSDIIINEDDIENLKRSKGAIYSAIISLLNKVEQNISDISKIYIAGGFGNYLNIDNAIAIGLLPDIDRNIYEFVGNSALAGARMSAVSAPCYEKSAKIAKNITYIDLGEENSYMDEYVASLFFPHTDGTRFPSVSYVSG